MLKGYLKFAFNIICVIRWVGAGFNQTDCLLKSNAKQINH